MMRNQQADVHLRDVTVVVTVEGIEAEEAVVETVEEHEVVPHDGIFNQGLILNHEMIIRREVTPELLWAACPVKTITL